MDLTDEPTENYHLLSALCRVSAAWCSSVQLEALLVLYSISCLLQFPSNTDGIHLRHTRRTSVYLWARSSANNQRNICTLSIDHGVVLSRSLELVVIVQDVCQISYDSSDFNQSNTTLCLNDWIGWLPLTPNIHTSLSPNNVTLQQTNDMRTRPLSLHYLVSLKKGLWFGLK